jgi:hypothetical protein
VSKRFRHFAIRGSSGPYDSSFENLHVIQVTSLICSLLFLPIVNLLQFKNDVRVLFVNKLPGHNPGTPVIVLDGTGMLQAVQDDL